MISIQNVTCEYRTRPLSVTTQNPRFSWEVISDNNDVYQNAYQIQVQEEDGEIVWDSKRQESRQTTLIPYMGKALDSAACYRYLITIWGADNHEVKSDSRKFETAFLTMNYVGTSLLAAAADLYVKISEKLGHLDKAEEYRSYANRVREAYDEEYVNGDGKLGQDMQGNYILDVLCDYGYSDTAWKVLWQEKCPSWLYEIKHGATTIWENWDAVKEDGSVGDCSFNHYAFGCVGDFMYRRILGIQNTGIGYDKIRIAPAYHCGLEWAEGSYHSVHGEIRVRWEKKGKEYLISVRIPANTTAAIEMPDGAVRELGNGVFRLNNEKG